MNAAPSNSALANDSHAAVIGSTALFEPPVPDSQKIINF